MRRRLLNVATALSLLLLLAMAALWVRSYFGGDYGLVGHWDLGPTVGVNHTLYIDTYIGGVVFTKRYQRDAYSAEEGRRILAEKPAAWGVRFGSRGAIKHSVGWVQLENGGFWRRMGFDAYRLQDRSSRGRTNVVELVDRRVCLPYWALLMLFAAGPAWRFPLLYWRRRARARSAAGLCVGCGTPAGGPRALPGVGRR